MRDLTTREKHYLTNINTETEKMALGDLVQSVIDTINDGVEGVPGPQGPAGVAGPAGPAGEDGVALVATGTPVNAISASEILAIDGVVLHGESVTIDDNVFQFTADVAQTVDEDAIPVNINAATVKAHTSLTVDVNPSLGDTMTLDDKLYTFVPLGTGNGDGEIDVGALLADTQENIVKAILGTDGHNEPHATVWCQAAFIDDSLVVRALVGGTAGNDIATEETFTANSNVFSGVKLQNGSDCAAADAVTALALAINESDTGFAAVGGIGDTVVISSIAGGEFGNATPIAEDLANGAFVDDAVLLSGGVDGTPGLDGEQLKDDSWLYICVGDQDETGKNWRRMTLGAPF